MRIRPPEKKQAKAEPVLFGKDSGGRRQLIRAAMEAGFSQRVAAKAVDTIIQAWIRALGRRDKQVVAPLGHFKVQKLRGKQFKARVVLRGRFGDGSKTLHTWTVNNHLYEVLWRISRKDLGTFVENPSTKNHS